jgi:hypothetical protein
MTFETTELLTLYDALGDQETGNVVDALYAELDAEIQTRSSQGDHEASEAVYNSPRPFSPPAQDG